MCLDLLSFITEVYPRVDMTEKEVQREMKEDDLLQLRGWSPEDEVQIKLQWCTVHVSTDCRTN